MKPARLLLALLAGLLGLGLLLGVCSALGLNLPASLKPLYWGLLLCLLGVALMLAFCMLAPLLDTASKLATDTIPVGQITAARFVVQAALMLPIAILPISGSRDGCSVFCTQINCPA